MDRSRHGGGNTVMDLSTDASMNASPWLPRPVPWQPGTVCRWEIRTVYAVTRIRTHLREQLARPPLATRCTHDAREDLLLAFEELTSNAVRHGGGGAVNAQLLTTATGWLLVVDDEAPDRPPVPAAQRDPALGGMGLTMVAALSRHCGWHAHPGHKSVWAELPSGL